MRGELFSRCSTKNASAEAGAFLFCYDVYMKIIAAKDALYVSKPEGTGVHYYLFKDYEVHYNEQAPHTTQGWHHHEKIWETLYIINGELVAKWREANEEKSQLVKQGDLIETERTPHTFSNDSDQIVSFLVIKHIPSEENHSKVLKTDKVLD